MSKENQRAMQRIRAMEQEIRQLKRSVLASPVKRPELSLPLNALVLQVSGFLIALPVDQVEEVTPMVLVSPLPRAPAAVRGTVSYRGRLAPVLDLNYSFSGTLGSLTPEMFLALISGEENIFALVVDQVEGMHQFHSQDMDSAPVLSSLPGFVYCLLRKEQHPVVLLDPASLLTAGELDVLRELLSEITGAGKELAG